MPTLVINNLLLPENVVLVLPDEGEMPTTGIIKRWSEQGGGRFESAAATSGKSIFYDHILFVREMTTEVEIDNVEYLAMHEDAVVGLIPD